MHDRILPTCSSVGPGWELPEGVDVGIEPPANVQPRAFRIYSPQSL